ncbi:MAG TPA: hypothetical protein VMH92_13110 [Acidocella sp.]|nr:hypothetical protein [Acidocella sp.]
MTDRQSPPERELNHAGSVVDKAIEYMIGQELSELAIASALLGGAMGLLTRSLPDAVVVQILQNAIESIESGEMHAASGQDKTGQA